MVNYLLQYPIAADGGGTITELNINRPTIGDINAVKDYLVDGHEIWMGRLLLQLTTLSLTETSKLDLTDVRVLLNMISKL